jgi:hypothetical protein
MSFGDVGHKSFYIFYKKRKREVKNHKGEFIIMADDRLKHLNLIFDSPAIQSQFSAWTQQRNMLKSTVSEMYTDGAAFKNWWTKSSSEVRAAMLMTALEDLPENTAFSSLIVVVCPELLDPNNFLDDTGDKVAQLLDILINGRENHREVFSFASFVEEFEEEQTKPSPAAQNAMQLARSCVLLQFATSILLIFKAQLEGAE